MKSLTVLVLLAGLVLAGIAWKTSGPLPLEAREIPRTLPAEPAGDHVRLRFAVEGMCCMGCPEKLRDALAEVEGVHALAADPAEGRVEVEVAPDLAPETLAAVLTFDKYAATPLPSLAGSVRE